MPELPEVECVRRSLVPPLVGRRVTAVDVRRRDVVHGPCAPAALLCGHRVTALERRGKQLAIVGAADNGAPGVAVCVHLGMTGSLVHRPSRHTSSRPRGQQSDHVHLIWTLDDGGRLLFRDPRRFGGVWSFDSMRTLAAQRWSALGPDALAISAEEMYAGLSRSRRPIKAALLDQAVVAGLGNIYVCELLFACGIHPLTPARRLDAATVATLVDAMRGILQRAIRGGGSTLRDYLDGNGQPGGYQTMHQVYGRENQPCVGCGQPLRLLRLQGRATAFCPRCQPRRWVKRTASRGHSS